jgi:hypothetical protein
MFDPAGIIDSYSCIIYSRNEDCLLFLFTELQNDLVKVQLRKEAPFNTMCTVCECETQTPIHCYDCSQCVQYCSDCEIKSHSNVSFHKPEMWRVKCF